MPQCDSHLARARGWLAESQGQLVEARRYYETSLALWRKMDNRPELPTAQIHLGRVCARLGDLDTAEQHLQQALQTLDEWASQSWPQPAIRALALAGLDILQHAQGKAE